MENVKTTLETGRIKSDGTYNIINRIINYKKIYNINFNISIDEIYWNSSDR